MDNIIVQIYSCNKLTYKNIYLDAVIKAYAKDGIKIDKNIVKIQIIDLSEGGTKEIQQQRAPTGEHCRIMQVLEDGVLKYLIGVSNTNYDEDIRVERQTTGRKNKYGSNDYHANTYLLQGVNKIFSRYFDLKSSNRDLKLYFYLLDTDKTYPHNKFNLCSYRMLSTLGFEVLNINDVCFDEFKEYGFKPNKEYTNIGYVSFNKLMNDKLAISKRNSANLPAYLKCEETILDDGTISTERYIYTFKSLGAQAYDCFLTIWALYVLAERESKVLDFEFALEQYGFKNSSELKQTKDLPKTLKDLLNQVGIHIHYETSDEVLQEYDKKLSQFERAKANNDLRNQELFRNNIRAKGILTRCPICGCELEDSLEAAHLWGVSQIKSENGRNISKMLSETILCNLINPDHPYKDDMFYKRYVLANSGDNGIWLCRNHHGLYDNNYFCFDSEYGKVVVKLGAEDRIKEILNLETLDISVLTSDIMTEATKIFLSKRLQDYLKKSVVL